MIKWINKYSDTMEDDKFGRWARVACVGEGLESIEVSWIKKCQGKGMEDFFVVSYLFPSEADFMFDELEKAKETVEKELKNFIKLCQTKPKQP